MIRETGDATADVDAERSGSVGKQNDESRIPLLTRHCVTRLVHEGGRLTGVMYKSEPDGVEQFMSGPRVFVSVL